MLLFFCAQLFCTLSTPTVAMCVGEDALNIGDKPLPKCLQNDFQIVTYWTTTCSSWNTNLTQSDLVQVNQEHHNTIRYNLKAISPRSTSLDDVADVRTVREGNIQSVVGNASRCCTHRRI